MTLLTSYQAMRKFGICSRTLTRWANQGKIVSVGGRGKKRYREDTIRSWVNRDSPDDSPMCALCHDVKVGCRYCDPGIRDHVDVPQNR